MNINEEGKYCNHNLAPVEYPTSGSLQLCQNGYNNTLFLLITELSQVKIHKRDLT